MRKVTPFLWFDDDLEEALDFYRATFRNVAIHHISRTGEAPDSPIFSAVFEIEGQQLFGLNGGPHHPFTDAISLFVSCEDQMEVDDLWEKLTMEGEPGRCGWLKDRFGLSWQIIPKRLGELLGDPNREKAAKVLEAMMRMDRIEVELLERAYLAG